MGPVALVLDIHHALLLVQAAVHAGRLPGIVEAGALGALWMRAVLVADVHHVLQLVSAAEDPGMAACTCNTASNTATSSSCWAESVKVTIVRAFGNR